VSIEQSACSPDRFSLEHEIHLPQPALGSRPNGKTFRAQFNGFRVFHERLPPDLSECLLEGQVHHAPSKGADYMAVGDAKSVCGRTEPVIEVS
jgi:hypothetical protein